MSSAKSFSQSSTTDRFGWLDFAKGLCILSVVWMWTDKYLELQSGWFHGYARFSLPFRMPDFFLISGLLLGRVIARPWRNYLDTRVVHYLYFLIVWTFIYIPVSWIAESPGDLKSAISELLAGITIEPKGNLWFMQMLAVYFLVTRLLRQVPAAIMFAASVLVYLHPLPTRIYAVELFGNHYVFFYAGYILADRILQASNWIQENRVSAAVALAAWAIGNFLIMVPLDFRLGDNPVLALILRFAGVGGVIAFSSLAWSSKLSTWITYVGRNSIVVYLGFFIPLSFFVTLTSRFGIEHENSTIAFLIWLACVLLSIVAFLLVRNTKLRYLYERPSWARVPAAPVGEAGNFTEPEEPVEPTKRSFGPTQ